MLLALLELIVFFIAFLFFITQIIIPISQNAKVFPILYRKENKKESEKKADQTK
jgi:hypothetical protein